MSLRDLLRRETRPYHDRIERSLAITEAIRDELQYTRLLERYYGFYAAIESKLSEFSAELTAVGIDLEVRRKCSLLRQDLESLGARPFQASDPEICANLPELSKLSQALGCLYVLEGSTLGGQLIYRHFQKTLGISVETGGRFFMCYGPETGRMWHALIEQLNSFGNPTEHHSEVTQAACQTFECLESWLLASPRTSP